MCVYAINRNNNNIATWPDKWQTKPAQRCSIWWQLELKLELKLLLQLDIDMRFHLTETET